MQSGTRATRQRSKPVFLNLKKTEFGYEVIPDPAEVAPPKQSISKKEKSSSPTRSKTTGKEGQDPENPSQEPVRPQKTKSLMKTGVSGSKNLNSAGKMKVKKSPSHQTGDEGQKKDGDPGSPNSMDGTPRNPEDGPNETPSMEVEREKPDRSERTGRWEKSDKVDKLNGNRLMEPKILDFNIFEDVQMTKKYNVVTPSCADWFNMDSINQIEKDALPEFFQGKPSKTPLVYMKYRNFIINLYRQNPRFYLYSTTCRRNLCGDACAIIRVHNFLDHWGLINFNIDPSSHPQNLYAEKPNFASEKIFRTSKASKNAISDEQDENIASLNDENDIILNQARVFNKNARLNCNYCGQICGFIWYQQKSSHSQQTSPYALGMKPSQSSDVILCTDCFAEGKLPNLLTANDFTKMDLLTKFNSNLGKNPSTWTQEETLMLVDLVSRNPGRWQDIQPYFPNKALEDIILHYLQLPVKNIKATKPINYAGENLGSLTSAERMIALAPEVLENASDNPLYQSLNNVQTVLNKIKGKPAKKDAITEEIIETKEENGEAIKEEAPAQEMNQNRGEEVVKVLENDEPSTIGDIPRNQDIQQQIKKDQGFGASLDKLNTISDKQGRALEEIEKETIKRAQDLKKKEEEKIRETANLIVDLQINKLEAKLGFLEEYEKVLLQESKQHELLKKILIADRINLTRKRLDIKPPAAATKENQPKNSQSFGGGGESRNPEQSFFGMNYPAGGGAGMDELLNLGNLEVDGFQSENF